MRFDKNLRGRSYYQGERDAFCVRSLDSFAGQQRRILCAWSFLAARTRVVGPFHRGCAFRRVAEKGRPLSPPDWKRIVSRRLKKKIRFPLHSSFTPPPSYRPISSKKRPFQPLSVNRPVFPCLPTPRYFISTFFQTLFPNLLVSSNNRGAESSSTLKFL